MLRKIRDKLIVSDSLKMDLSPSPFWIKNKQQTLVFDFSSVSNERCNDDADDDSSEIIVGKEEFT